VPTKYLEDGLKLAVRCAATNSASHQKSTAVNQSGTTAVRHSAATQPKETSSHVSSSFGYGEFFKDMVQRKKDDHSYRIFRKVNRAANHFPMAEDYTFSERADDITVWCSNDYLGMSRHPTVTSAAMYIISKHGVGAGGTRNISGTSLYHGMLEQVLADWHEKEAGLLFTSCYVANDTALFTLGQQLPGCIIFSDAGNHASMIQGIRNSKAKKVIFRHNDVEHLEELLKEADPDAPKIVAFESVHSMSGAVCPVEKMCDVAHKYGALTFVDEVHAVGLYGERGAGIGDREKCMDKMDIISGTLGKAVGVIGGYLVGKASVIDYLRSYGSGFIFTTALPPDKVYTAITSINILQSSEGQMLREKHQANVRNLRSKLLKRGLPVEYAPSHIVPVHTGDPEKGTMVSNLLQQEHGIYIQAINYPTVARGQEKLRIAPTPFHTEKMVDTLVKAMDDSWSKVGLPYSHKVCSTDCDCEFVCADREKLAF